MISDEGDKLSVWRCNREDGRGEFLERLLVELIALPNHFRIVHGGEGEVGVRGPIIRSLITGKLGVAQIRRIIMRNWTVQ